MKNSVNCLIRKSVRRQRTDGSKVMMLDSTLENIPCCDINFVEDIIYQNQVKLQIISIINTLNEKEKQLVLYIFFKGYSMKKYSDFKMIPYYKVVDMKTNILSKLKLAFKVDNYCKFTN